MSAATHPRGAIRYGTLLAVLLVGTCATAGPALHAVEVRRTSGGSTVTRQISQEDVPSGHTALPMPQMPPHPMPPEGTPWVTNCPCDAPGGVRGGPEPLGVLTGYGYWARAEYLGWWRKGQDFPALVTGGPDGVLPGAPVLFGNEELGDQWRHGGRFTVGMPIGDTGCWGLAARATVQEDFVADFRLNSDQVPVFGRPFFNVDTQAQDAFLVSFPGTTQFGEISVLNTSDVFSGELILQRLWFTTERSRVDFLFGFQAAQIDDALRIESTSLLAGDTELNVIDEFDISNEFYGGHIGLLGQYQNHRWGVEVLAKIAFGNMNQLVTIDGQTNGVTGGLLARSSNIGRFESDQFAVNPELNVNVTYQLTSCVDFVLGYSFLYWNHVMRSTDALDPQLGFDPGADPDRPAFVVRDSDFWVQGLNAGIHVRF